MSMSEFWDSLRVTALGYRLLHEAARLPQRVIVVTSLPQLHYTGGRSMDREIVRAASEHKAQLADALGLPVVAAAAPPQVAGWTNVKSALAGPRKILVDDSPSTIEAFAAAGGQAIMVPQPWNNATPDPVGLLTMLCEEIEGVDFPRSHLPARDHGLRGR